MPARDFLDDLTGLIACAIENVIMVVKFEKIDFLVNKILVVVKKGGEEYGHGGLIFLGCNDNGRK
jgi:hypothetical protein